MRKSLAIFAVIATLAFMAFSTVSCANESGGSSSFKGGSETVDFASLGVTEITSITSSNPSVISFKNNPPSTVVTMTVSKPGTTTVTIKGKMGATTFTEVDEYTIKSDGDVDYKNISMNYD